MLDASHRIRVNYETYFVADAAERKQFLADPLDYCGPVTDPVSKQRFRPDASSPRFDYAGTPYFFLDPGHMARFAAAPDSFTAPRFLKGMGHRITHPDAGKS